VDKEELAALQQTMRLVALEEIVRVQTSQLLRLLKAVPVESRGQALSVFLLELSLSRRALEDMTFENFPPEQSDLRAGELQEAFDDVCKKIEAALNALR